MNPEPQPPQIPVTLPDPLAGLARADVKSMTSNPQNPTVEVLLANHDVRLALIEKEQERTNQALNWIMRITITTLLAAAGSLLLLFLKKG